MPDRMPNRMSEDMSDRMPEDLPVRKCINVMVGITRSKVIMFISCYKLVAGVMSTHSHIWLAITLCRCTGEGLIRLSLPPALIAAPLKLQT